MNDVINFINNINIKSEYVIAAISGGPDSMYLLDILYNLNFKIVVAHVHHNIRKESDYEAETLKKYCEEKNIIFEMMKIEKYTNDKFSEVEARKLRYEFFDKLIKKYNSDILFTAHHGDDLIETILMRLTRGSSIKGYAGFERISTDRGYKIARPLIFLTKKEIEEYLDKNGLWYAKDVSNESDKYTRNRYRKYILPELKKENPLVHYKFIDYNDKMLMIDNYMKSIATNFLNDKKEINTIEFNKLDKIVKIYVLEQYLKNIYEEEIIKINNQHIDILIELICKNKNCCIDLPLNKKAIIEYNIFRISDNKVFESYEYEFTNYIDLPNGKKIRVDNETTNTSNFVIHLNSEEIKLPFHVRTRKNGDYMIIKNMTGRKKINDILIDSKISKDKRDSIPIVTDDSGEIIWIPGIKKSHLDRKKELKYDIILKYD